MANRRVFVQNRDFLQYVAGVTGTSMIDLEWAFDRAGILGEICFVTLDIDDKQAAMIDELALKFRKERPKPNKETT